MKLTSQRRKSVLSAELSAAKSKLRLPIRYDRLSVFILLLAASVLILSQGLLETRIEPTVGMIAEHDIFVPRDFVFYDTPAAEAKWRAEFEKLPAPYVFETRGFDESIRKLLDFFEEGEETSPAALIISDPGRRRLARARVRDLVDRAKNHGLLEKSFESEREISIRYPGRGRLGADDTRAANSAEILQPDEWAKYLRGLEEDEILRVSNLLDQRLPPTLVFDAERAENILANLRKQFPVEPIRLSSEEPVITVGQELSERDVELVGQRNAFARRRNIAMLTGLTGLLGLTLLFGAFYMKKYLSAMYDRVRDVSAICFAFGSVLLLCLVVKMALVLDFGMIKLSHAALPVPTVALLLTLLYGARMAFVFSMLTSVLIAATIAPRLELLVMFLFGSMTAAVTAATARRRSDLFRSGLFVAVVQLTVVMLIGMMHGTPFVSVRIDIVSAVVSAALSAAFVQILLLPFEGISHRTSSFTLIELGDLNHPLLQMLLRKAPGTFQHSQHVAILAQSAAEAIGANALLARVGAYFHDIGKMRKPEYFTENQGPGENPHDKLKPSLSASILKAHVIDGIILAQEERLPESVIDFIAQHHGTSAMTFFYHRALESAGEEIDVNRSDFQYPGPMPQTPEIGITMLADRVEATARAMNAPTTQKLDRMVRRTIGEIFESGQLNECELTLKDLTVISENFTRVLGGIFHTRRVEYPDADEIADAEKKARGE